MNEWWKSIHVNVVDDEIIVSLPGTRLQREVLINRENFPQLLARNISHSDDERTPVRQSDFLARAWRRANDKARKLGWIV